MIEKYLSNWGEDGAARRGISIKGSGGEKADEAKKHGGGGDSKANVHAGVGLEPHQESERGELSSAERKVSAVEESGELFELLWVLLWELVCPMGYDVRLQTPTSQSHQIQRDEEHRRFAPARLHARRRCGSHVARRRPQSWVMGLHCQQSESLHHKNRHLKPENVKLQIRVEAIEFWTN